WRFRSSGLRSHSRRRGSSRTKMPNKQPHAKSQSSKTLAKCGAKTKRRDGSCTKSAGWRTDHPGVGKCYLHGGATPIKSGRYSKTKRESLRERIEAVRADPDPLNLEPEVALLRALVEDLIERWDEVFGPGGALIAWHNSFGSEKESPKPRQLPDFSSISQLVDRVGAMVD